MNRYIYILAIVGWTLPSCKSPNQPPQGYESNSLKIKPITESAFIHTSYLDIPNYGNFPCNGMIIINGKEAIVVDTPTSDEVAAELIEWVENELKCEIKAVVVSHFHVDCLGGLTEFHKKHIPSLANNSTISLANQDGAVSPTMGFDLTHVLEVGNKKIMNQYFGEGHTRDNIVSYVSNEEILFGGCLVKEVGAGKGNLADANTSEWSNTVAKIKTRHPNLKFVVPGHGEVGGIELLDYTIKLFAKE